MATAVANLGKDLLLDILRRLSLVDLFRAALACQSWRLLAARCIPREPPLLGYFFHPEEPSPPLPEKANRRLLSEAVFAPLGGVDVASSPLHLSLDFAPDASRYMLYDCYQGLLLLQPMASIPKDIIPCLLVLDPVTRRRALLPSPPRVTLPDDRLWSGFRHYVGSALLSRGHPSKLCFEAVCLTIDGGHPRAWVASYDDGECRWRALPRATEVEITFDPWLFGSRCVHAAGNIYWHISRSDRLLALDPVTLNFSYLLAPAALGNGCDDYRIGETPEDGRLCIATLRDECMRLWVRASAETRSSDNGWFLEREMDMSKVYETVQDIPMDRMERMHDVIRLSDIDAGRTGKLFIQTLSYGRYSFDLGTGEMEPLVTNGGDEYGHPIYAYFLAWPPAFLAQDCLPSTSG